MGDIHRVELTHKKDTDGKPSSVVVKLPSVRRKPCARGSARDVRSRSRFYAELGEKTGTGLPKIYFSKIQSGTADFVIVMEDLSDLTMVDQSAGMSFEQALAAVKVLANIHAVWWGKVRTEELEWIPSMVGPRIEYVDQVLPQIYRLR